MAIWHCSIFSFWCSREFYYIQMEKYARQAIAEGVKVPEEIVVNVDSEIYRVLNLHYNRNNQIEVSFSLSETVVCSIGCLPVFVLAQWKRLLLLPIPRTFFNNSVLKMIAYTCSVWHRNVNKNVWWNHIALMILYLVEILSFFKRPLKSYNCQDPLSIHPELISLRMAFKTTSWILPLWQITWEILHHSPVFSCPPQATCDARLVVPVLLG